MITPKDALIKIAKKYRLHICNITAKSKGKESSIKACVSLKEPETPYIAVPIELWLNQTDPVPNILENLSYQISIYLNIHAYPTDQDFAAQLDAKLIHDPNDYTAIDLLQNYRSEWHELSDISYQIKRDYTKNYSKMRLKLNKPSTDPIDTLLAALFANWCKQNWQDNRDIPFLEYPERACLRFNTIQNFLTDLNYKLALDNQAFTFDIKDTELQTRIMRGFGTPDGQASTK